MAYIGRPLQVANLAVQSGAGDGSDTTPIATLDYATVTNGIAVYLDGVRQLAGTDFNVTSQTTLTFTTAPANGVGVDVYFLGLELSLPTPADATVTTAKIAANAVDETKLKDALVADFTDATVTASDYFLHGDATDSGNTKKDTVQGILDLVTITYDSEVRVHTGNGYGGTNNHIRRFTTVLTNDGSDITYSDSAGNGALFDIETAGIYAISYSDCFTGADYLGLSLNSSQLTTNIQAITVADRLASGYTTSGNATDHVSITIALDVGDLVRAHTAGVAQGTAALAQFSIVRVG